MWKVCEEVVPDSLVLLGASDKRSETSSLFSSPKSKVRPELGVLGYV